MVSGIAFNNSKFGSFFANAKDGSFKKILGSYLSGSGIAIADGVKETIPFPNTHTWSSPDVGRWYVKRWWNETF